MEYIRTFEEACEFAKLYIQFKDLIIVWDTDITDLMEAGFDQADKGHWTRDDMICTIEERPGFKRYSFGGIIKGYDVNTHTTRYDRMEELLCVDATIRMKDITIGVELELSPDRSFVVDTVRLFDNIVPKNMVHASRHRGVRVSRRVEDMDGRGLIMENDYQHGELVSTTYLKKGTKNHCLGGPAIIRHSKSQYWIDGMRYNKNAWMKKRDEILAQLK